MSYSQGSLKRDHILVRVLFVAYQNNTYRRSHDKHADVLEFSIGDPYHVISRHAQNHMPLQCIQGDRVLPKPHAASSLESRT